MRKKNNSQIAHMAQMTANKLKDFHEDSYQNRDANKQVDYNKLVEMVEHLEDVAKILNSNPCQP